jgi:hypothetical protein
VYASADGMGGGGEQLQSGTYFRFPNAKSITHVYYLLNIRYNSLIESDKSFAVRHIFFSFALHAKQFLCESAWPSNISAENNKKDRKP